MICHTTYETIRGDPVYPQATNRFYPCESNAKIGGGFDTSMNAPVDFNKCASSNYNNSIPIRRPMLKDINYYLSRAEAQMLRHQQHQQQQPQQQQQQYHHYNHHSQHRNADDCNGNGTNARRSILKPSAQYQDRRKAHTPNRGLKRFS